MLSHSHQNPSLTLITHTLSGPSSGTKSRADSAVQKETTEAFGSQPC